MSAHDIACFEKVRSKTHLMNLMNVLLGVSEFRSDRSYLD